MKFQQLLYSVEVVLILCAGFLLAVSEVSIAEPEPNDLRADFETHYQLWKSHCLSVGWSSETGKRLDSEHYRTIVAMGPRVLPYIVEKHAADPNFGWTGWAWIEVARIIPNPKINRWAQESMLNWWEEGRKQAKKRFELLYDELIKFRKEGSKEGVDKTLKSIKAIGIICLPYVMEKIQSGNYELLPVVHNIIPELVSRELDISSLSQSEQAEAYLTSWKRNKEKWLIPFPNKKPVANAGVHQTVISGDVVQLDGLASRDADKDQLTYRWAQMAGPPVTLSDAAAAKPVFTAPEVPQQTVLTFQLTVNDGSPKKSAHPACESGQSDPDTVKVTVKPKG